MTRNGQPSFGQLQSWLQAAITVGTVGGSDRHALEGVSASELIRGGAASAQERLAVYSDGYLSRLEECLADDYGALKYALGDQEFSRLSAEYVARYPSTHPSLNGFGAQLPRFLSEHQSRFGLFAVYLARLEWAIVEVLHSRSSDGFAAHALGSLMQSGLDAVRFVPNEAVRLLVAAYPVNAFLSAFLDGGRPAVPDWKPSAALVVRSGYRLRRFDLDPSQLRVLQALLTGRSLGEALAGVEVSEAMLGAWFQAWTEAGVFASVLAPAGVSECN